MGNQQSLQDCCESMILNQDKQYEASGRVDSGVTRRSELKMENLLNAKLEDQNQDSLRNQVNPGKQNSLQILPSKQFSIYSFDTFPDSVMLFKNKNKPQANMISNPQNNSAQKQNKNKINPVINIIVSSTKKPNPQPPQIHHIPQYISNSNKIGSQDKVKVYQIRSLNNSIMKVKIEMKDWQSIEKDGFQSGRKNQSQNLKRNLNLVW